VGRDEFPMLQKEVVQDEISYTLPNESAWAEPSVELQPSVLASAEKRLTNFIVDAIACAVPFLVIRVAARLAHAPRPRFTSGIWGLLFLALVMLVYFIPLEAIWGRTLGKLITRTKVVALDGRRPTLWRIALRTLCRMNPFDAFSFIGSFAGNLPVGFHDKCSHTRVVMDK
jgi:uncharacterized RDD family membrane protein YckC